MQIIYCTNIAKIMSVSRQVSLNARAMSHYSEGHLDLMDKTGMPIKTAFHRT